MTQPKSLVIGEGFQDWIDSHQGTPESDEMYLNTEMRCMLVRISENGQDVRVWLIYNAMTNQVIPFVQATL